MSGDVEYGGLCRTCKNAPDCTFPRDPHKPVFYCEEFDTGISPPMKMMGKETSLPTPLHTAKNETSSEFMGLCVNCENREACTFPKPEGGVWHCEEYQ